jgi:hypothetical protein
MKHSYFIYAALTEDGTGIFQLDSSRDEDSGLLECWFNCWDFDPEILAECGYADQRSLEKELKETPTDSPAQIKKFKITVESLDA